MTKENFSQFLNSIWLMSSIKEWLLRVCIFGFLQTFILFFIDTEKHGLVYSLLPFLILLVAISLLTIISLIILYAKFCRGELPKNKSELFEN